MFMAGWFLVGWMSYLTFARVFGELCWYYFHKKDAKESFITKLLFPEFVLTSFDDFGKKSIIAPNNSGVKINYYDQKDKYVIDTVFTLPFKLLFLVWMNLVVLGMNLAKLMFFPIYAKFGTVEEFIGKVNAARSKVRVAITPDPTSTPEDELNKLLDEQEKLNQRINQLQRQTGKTMTKGSYR